MRDLNFVLKLVYSLETPAFDGKGILYGLNWSFFLFFLRNADFLLHRSIGKAKYAKYFLNKNLFMRLQLN